MADADVYLLDEVLAVGDVAFQEKCFNVFRKYKADGKTVVLVTHSPQSVKDFCDRAVFLKDGIIQPQNTVDDVIQAYING